MQQFVGGFGDTPEGFRPFTRSKTTAKTTYTISRDKVSPPKKTSKKMKRKENHIRCFNHKIIEHLDHQTQNFGVYVRTEIFNYSRVPNDHSSKLINF